MARCEVVVQKKGRMERHQHCKLRHFTGETVPTHAYSALLFLCMCVFLTQTRHSWRSHRVGPAFDLLPPRRGNTGAQGAQRDSLLYSFLELRAPQDTGLCLSEKAPITLAPITTPPPRPAAIRKAMWRLTFYIFSRAAQLADREGPLWSLTRIS